jgi:enoyl-CoA hydratase/carnithine racemase
MSSNALILAEARGDTLWIVLNRPDKANALTVGMSRGITAAIVRGVTDPSIRAIALTGAGERVFCAGVDVRERAPDGDEARHRAARSEASAALQDAIFDSPKPVVAILNGAAIGAGAMLALLADACVAADDISLSLPEVDIGIPSFLGASLLDAIGGRALSADLILSGRRMPASEAHARGLLREIAPRAQLAALAERVLAELGGKPAAAYAPAKQWLNRRLRAVIQEARAEHTRHRDGAGHAAPAGARGDHGEARHG